ncbi:MAG: 23S rRNA pseudouridine(2604) synthase RluF, partial [Ferruginibacter sp.]
MDKSLNKYISETGFCSRREADKYIEQGRVTINDNVAIKGNRVMPGDTVEVDGEPVKKKDKTVYIVFNKPVGITCTTDLKDKHNIISFINYKNRIFPIGRLDKPSEGLIFLTNDGDIVNKILRAGNNHEKEYVVTVDKPITGDFITRMGNGVRILDTVTKKCFVKQEGKNRFRIILTQGLNRQIRRMCQALAYNVVTLKRVRIMNITLANLPAGKWRYFTPEEIKTMDLLVATSSKTAEGFESMGYDMQE